MIGVVAYGMGNVRSVLNALEHVGADAALAATPEDLDRADKILLPGVGAFGEAMRRLTERGVKPALDEQVLGRGKPILGICLGMQLLAETGTEFGEAKGLGYIPGRVEIIPREDRTLRLPHMGWNGLDIVKDCPLLGGIAGDTCCYFVHSYHLKAGRPGDVSATCDYGGPVTAAVSAGHIFGTQFHPEKSQRVGLRILSNFAAL
jgi:glutamine amidotransferase